jgi:poly-gamma-glutamate capsule biosynthesis protein CapA/YwtB (metallophosphatase superfamily)
MLSFGVALGIFLFVGWTAVGSPGTTVPGDLVASETTPTTLAPTTTVRPTTSTVPPTTTTSTTPPTTTTTLPARGTLVIHGTGDVALDPWYIPTLRQRGWDHAWSGLGSLFLDDDLTVINLECAPSDLGEPLPKEFTFRCPVEALGSLRANGVEVANLGNNHSGDFGKEALVDGHAQLLAHGVVPVGAGRNHAEAGRPALYTLNGWTVAVVGFGGITPADSWYATDDRPGMRNGKDIAGMVEAIKAAKELADIVVVTIHWGRELDTEPRDTEVASARAMIEAGANIIFGHHSHRLQPLEMVDGAAVFWSLGNFVWPRLSDASATTAVGRVVVHPDGTIEACKIPAFIRTHGRPELTGDPGCGPRP